MRILNSTPRSFSSVYIGARGDSQIAKIKIQLEYNLLSGKFLHIHTGPGKQHDQSYCSLYASTVTANDLCIQHLDYLHLKALEHIQNKKFYYISRIKLYTFIQPKISNLFFSR
ncbi:transposase [Bacillus thuringiensis]|nr:transposase [Bacillus thuringiensis]